VPLRARPGRIGRRAAHSAYNVRVAQTPPVTPETITWSARHCGSRSRTTIR
jgi:hypothetical protein